MELVVIAKRSNGRRYIPRLNGRSLRGRPGQMLLRSLGSFHHCCALVCGRQCTFPGAVALLLQQLED